MKAKMSPLAAKVTAKAKWVGEGSFGAYAKHGNHGIKVIARSRYAADVQDSAGFKSRAACLDSEAFKKAKREAVLLKKAGKLSTLPPKFYEVGVYKIGKRWYAGIIMEHIKGYSAEHIKRHYVRPFRGKRWWDKQEQVMNDVIAWLRDCGIEYKDRNPLNFMRDTKRRCWRIIDFTPGWVKFLKDEDF